MNPFSIEAASIFAEPLDTNSRRGGDWGEGNGGPNRERQGESSGVCGGPMSSQEVWPLVKNGGLTFRGVVERIRRAGDNAGDEDLALQLLFQDAVFKFPRKSGLGKRRFVRCFYGAFCKHANLMGFIDDEHRSGSAVKFPRVLETPRLRETRTSEKETTHLEFDACNLHVDRQVRFRRNTRGGTGLDAHNPVRGTGSVAVRRTSRYDVGEIFILVNVAFKFKLSSLFVDSAIIAELQRSNDERLCHGVWCGRMTHVDDITRGVPNRPLHRCVVWGR